MIGLYELLDPETKLIEAPGLKYQKNRLRTCAIYWRCWKDCRANLQTNVFDLDDRNPNIQILQESSHTHEEDDLVIGHDRVRNTLRNNIRQDPSVLIKRIYDHVVRNYAQGGGDRETIQEFDWNMYPQYHMILMMFPFVDYGNGLGQKIGFCCTQIMTGVF